MADCGSLVIGISGVSRSGKGWVSKGLLQALEAMGRKACIIGQDEFWFQPCQVNVRGQMRTSEEEAECTNHEKLAAVINESAKTHDVVIAEGFQLVHHPQVTGQLNCLFLIELDKAEARRRRTQPQDAKLNPNPLSPEDFDDLLWPAHERYMNDKVAPLGENVAGLPSPNTPEQRDELVQHILLSAGLVMQDTQSYDQTGYDQTGHGAQDTQRAEEEARRQQEEDMRQEAMRRQEEDEHRRQEQQSAAAAVEQRRRLEQQRAEEARLAPQEQASALEATAEPQDFAGYTYGGGTGGLPQDTFGAAASMLDSHILNAHVPPRFTEEERFAQKVDARRRFEAERRMRIFDAKRRTIGVDKDALDAQVAERKRLDEETRHNNGQEFADFRRMDRELKLVEAAKVNAKRSMEKDCKDHSLNHLHFAARREYDLNDPKATRKDLPGRVGDNDPRCGPASMQQFAGEDLLKEERVRQQKDAMVNYIEQQRFEKAVLADKGDGKEFVAEAAEIQAIRNQMEDHETNLRKDMRRQVRDANQATEAAHHQSRCQQLAQNAFSNAQEIHCNVNGPLLSENSQLYKKNGQVVRETFKGSNRTERLACAADQHVQRFADADKKQQAKLGEHMEACQMEGARQVTIATERNRQLDRRMAAMQVAQDNKRMHEEQKKKTQTLNEQYTNKFSNDFFAQFGTHTR